MKYNFCTLFDCGYLDKGLALYQSLKEHVEDFCLYVLAMDKEVYEILRECKFDDMEVFFIEDIETERMRTVKKSRTRGEYCWTCTPIVIEYTLDHYNLENCTYVDSDVYFYSTPVGMIEKMREKGCSVLITKHGYPRTREGKIMEKKSGKYCVQFNTFLNTSGSREILSWWKEKCLECCTSVRMDGKLGDQKYLENWTSDFSGVYESEEWGGGVANWNIMKFKLLSVVNGEAQIMNIEEKKCGRLIFYHFHGLQEYPNGRVKLQVFRNFGKVDKDLVAFVYDKYFSAIKSIRKEIKEKYNIEFPYVKIQKNDQIVTQKEPETIEEKFYNFMHMIKGQIYRKRDNFYW